MNDERNKIDGHIIGLERGVMTLQERIREAKTRRNALASISRLPNELLCRVFSIYKADVTTDSDEINWYLRQSWSGWDKRRLAWMKVTHVCRRWRDAAVNHVALWSNFDEDASPAFWDLCLKRSKNATFTLFLAGRPHHQHPFERQGRAQRIASLLKDGRRLKSLTISIHSPEYDYQALLNGISTPNPCLKSLILDDDKPLRHNTTLKGIVLPPALLSGATSRLTELRLARCQISWPSVPLLEGLKTFRLKQPHGTPSPAPGDLLQALRNIPNVVELSLAIAFPVMDVAPESRNTIHLAHLRHLNLVGPMKGCGALVYRLTTPASTKIEFDVLVNGDLADCGMSELTCALSSLWSSPTVETDGSSTFQNSRWQSLQIVPDASVPIGLKSFSVSLKGWTTPIAFTNSRLIDSHHLPIPAFNFRAAGPSSLGLDMGVFLDTITRALPQTCLQTVRAVDIPTRFNSNDDLARILSPLTPTLEDVTLHEWSASQFIDWIVHDPALLTEARSSGGTETPSVRAPRLKRITLYKAIFGGPVCTVEDGPPLDFWSMHAALIAREARGAVLERIEFIECPWVNEGAMVSALRKGLGASEVVCTRPDPDGRVYSERACCYLPGCPRWRAYREREEEERSEYYEGATY